MNSAVFKGRGMVGIEGYDSACVSLDTAGRLTVWTTTPTVGQGTDTTFAQLAADALSLDPHAVRVAAADTSVGGLAGTGTFASRSAVSAGGAIALACAELEERLLLDASSRLELPPEELELDDGHVRARSAPNREVGFRELVLDAAPGRYETRAQWDPPAVAYPYATHACVVEADAGTGGVKILRYAICDDCGRVINPLIVAGQVHGATVQGIAESLSEGIVYDEEGQLRNASLMDFLVPTAAEIPEFELRHLEIPSPTTVNGVKGVGEGGTIGAAPAVVSAVSDAVGEELTEIPIAPETVMRAARALLVGAR
jgi:carbon-monoxide dehydrogenase large subunit